MKTLTSLLGILLLLIGVILVFVALNVMTEKTIKVTGNYYTPFKWWHILGIGLIGDALGLLGLYMIH